MHKGVYIHRKVCIILIIESKHRESNNMNNTNFKTQTQTLIQIELDAWSTGEKTFNMSNQFDESILESALENTDNESAMSEAFEMYSNGNYCTMTIAHFLSAFEAPEIAGAWIN